MYIVEGNIGAGKSTFLKLLEKNLPQAPVALEPLQNWQSTIYGQSLLTNFYEDPKRWAYTLETLTMMCRVREHLNDQTSEHKNKIIERSIYSGHYAFAYNSYESGFMTDLEWRVYNEWFNFLIPNKCKAPLGFIYLKVDPNIAYQRLKKRNRAAEKTISLKYLRQIHERHESFLIKDKRSLAPICITPVLVLDCNEEFENNEMLFQQHLEKVKNFMHMTQSTFVAAKTDWQMLRREPIVDDEMQVE